MMTPIRFSLPFRLAGLWLGLFAFSASDLSSQQNLVISGSHTSGTMPCQAVNTIVTDQSNPFTVGGSASITCQAGGSIRLLPVSAPLAARHPRPSMPSSRPSR